MTNNLILKSTSNEFQIVARNIFIYYIHLCVSNMFYIIYMLLYMMLIINLTSIVVVNNCFGFITQCSTFEYRVRDNIFVIT
jgi:hypothetical protein